MARLRHRAGRHRVACQRVTWTRPGSNRPPPLCESGALPDELRALEPLIPKNLGTYPERDSNAHWRRPERRASAIGLPGREPAAGLEPATCRLRVGCTSHSCCTGLVRRRVPSARFERALSTFSTSCLCRWATRAENGYLKDLVRSPRVERGVSRSQGARVAVSLAPDLLCHPLWSCQISIAPGGGRCNYRGSAK
jgi:hypothetical protein